MNKYFETIDGIDKRLSDHFINRGNKNLKRLIHLVAVNPVIFYGFFFVVNIAYFENKYLLLFVAFIFLNTIFVIFKQIFKRVRPIPRKGNLIHELLDFQPDNYSFPSAHSFSMFQLIPLSFILFGYLGFFFLIYAFFIAFTRIYMGYHYLSDVVVGMFFGTISGAILLTVYLSYF